MSFNSIDFAVFLPIVFILYWFIFKGELKKQNLLVLVSSYLFYGWWDWRFLSLILFSTIVDYLIGLKIAKESNHSTRKTFLFLSIFCNLGLLGIFKYYNFFLDNLIFAFSFFGRSLRFDSLQIILPVGISFYTFQTMSYTIDIYRKKLEPTKSFIAFAAFVSFFPQLVAGPIERASNLLPQFHKKRLFNYNGATDGLRQILWGFFKKIVIADNCATYVNLIFENSDTLSGSTLVLGAFLFTFQIYGDFSGYSDIAIGTARLFGFDLKQNFAFPYFSRDIAEFWRRWHISLSTWFRDYLYIPLGGSRGGTWMKIRNTFIIFLVSGFWHGANWTFIAWGALNAFYFLPLLLLQRNRINLDVVAKDKYFPSVLELGMMLFTFCITLLAWIFFRADSISHALNYISTIFSVSLFTTPSYASMKMLTYLFFIVILVVIEWFGREKEHALQLKDSSKISRVFRWILYYMIIIILLIYPSGEQEFIYFQF